MNVDLINNLITSGVTLVVGAVGAIYAYKGALNGAKMQIESEQERAKVQHYNEMAQLDEARHQQAEFTRKAIENFISNEIKKNFRQIEISPYLLKELEANRTPFEYWTSNSVFDDTRLFEYEEYNKFKYELIKYESNEIQDILAIYDMFQLIEEKQVLTRFTQSEYESFKKFCHLSQSKYQ